MDAYIDKTFMNVGEVIKVIDTLRDVEGMPDKRFLLLLHWPKQWDELSIQVEKIAPKGQGNASPDRSNKLEKFFQEPAKVVELLKSYRVDRSSVPEAIGYSHLRIAILNPGDSVRLTIKVDTDAPAFLHSAKMASKANKPLVRTIEYVAIPMPEGNRRGEPAGGIVRLVMRHARKMPRYDGIVAIDFGTTGSTMACVEGVDPIRLIPLEPFASRPDALSITGDESTDSAILIKEYEKPKSSELMEEKIDCVHGKEARSQEDQGGYLAVGAKRILVDTETEKPIDAEIGRNRHELPKYLPAELFLSEVFKVFHKKRQQVPMKVVVTCPTTYSHWEAERYRKAVLQGWRRSLRAATREFETSSKKPDWADIPQSLIDEASAAAFYLINNDHLELAGGLDVFQYIYPEGMNVLVCDYGGGTTDIALVQAKAEYGIRDGVPIPNLAIQVLGRSGHRRFGGDDMTVAVFKVLKAKIAARLTRLGGPKYPESPHEVPAFIKHRRREIDAAVPTLYDTDTPETRDVHARQQLVSALWPIAEQVKRELAGNATVEMRKVATGRPLSEFMMCLKDLQRIDDSTQADRILGFSISRDEVDGLIVEELDRSIDHANRLVRDKAKSGDLLGGEVHAVYVIGNASLYPLVGERFRARLAVRFVSQRIKPIKDRADLKCAVVKGAALATQFARGNAQGLGVNFDSTRVDRLPYDIAVLDRTKGGKSNTGVDVLFSEHTPYEALSQAPPSIKVPVIDETSESNDLREVYLFRRWPGEDLEAFLKFVFKERLVGPTITVWFNNEVTARNFMMRDEGTGEEVAGQALPTALYRAPEQSGQI